MIFHGEKMESVDNNENLKTYVVRLICQKKSLFVEFAEGELEQTKFAEKGDTLNITSFAHQT